MMKPANYDTVPLTDDERDLLLTIYDSRRRFLGLVYLVLIIVAFIYGWQGVDARSHGGGNIRRWEENEDAKFIPRIGAQLIITGFLESMVIGTGLYFFMKRVRPFLLDAKSGLKERLPYPIVRKEHFPLTNQFYVGFDDPNYLHHEIDEATYHNCSVGDTLYVYRGIRSKFVFKENGRFSIL
jgi:hypothetical protein